MGAERCKGNGVLIDDSLVEGGNQVEQGEDAAFAEGVENLVDAGDGELSEGADGVQLLVVNGDADASVFLRYGDHGAGVGGGGALDQDVGQVLVEDGGRLFGEDGVDAVWAGGNRNGVWRHGNVEGDKGTGVEVGLGGGKYVLEIAEGVT